MSYVVSAFYGFWFLCAIYYVLTEGRELYGELAEVKQLGISEQEAKTIRVLLVLTIFFGVFGAWVIAPRIFAEKLLRERKT